MQFNSFLFIFVFLPTFLLFYFVGNAISKKIGRYIIIVAGIIFYSFAGIKSLMVILSSVVINYVLAFLVIKVHKISRVLLYISIAVNIALLVFYKSISFVNLTVPAAPFFFQSVVMPLGVSFFTFQQIMYVINVFKGEIKKVDVVDYMAYILFFPKLIMGPLVEPAELLAQINNDELKTLNFDNLVSGIKMFCFGLFKKLVLADAFMRGVNWGFSNFEAATSMDVFLTMLFYTFEIYFDFSGYIDMATGISKMINIELPINFDSPYKAASVRDFWKKWHVSLTRFFTKYIYYPLGGNRKGKIHTYVNIMIVFLISGLWHGANYTFILWGGINGLLLVLERVFEKYYRKLSETVRWIYTFGAVNVLMLLFRSESITQWLRMLGKIFTFQSTEISDGLIDSFILPETPFLLRLLHLTTVNELMRGLSMLSFIVAGFVLCLVPENNYRAQAKRNIFNMVMASVAFVWGILCLSSDSVFVYFNF